MSKFQVGMLVTINEEPKVAAGRGIAKRLLQEWGPGPFEIIKGGDDQESAEYLVYVNFKGKAQAINMGLLKPYMPAPRFKPGDWVEWVHPDVYGLRMCNRYRERGEANIASPHSLYYGDHLDCISDAGAGPFKVGHAATEDGWHYVSLGADDWNEANFHEEHFNLADVPKPKMRQIRIRTRGVK